MALVTGLIVHNLRSRRGCPAAAPRTVRVAAAGGAAGSGSSLELCLAVPLQRDKLRGCKPHAVHLSTDAALSAKATERLCCLLCMTCTLLVGGCRYVADETPMASYLNVHQTLTQRREEALKAGAGGSGGGAGAGPGAGAGSRGAMGPVVIVLGPTDSGKSTLCRLLCNWGVRSGWQPTFVDLDVGAWGGGRGGLGREEGSATEDDDVGTTGCVARR